MHREGAGNRRCVAALRELAGKKGGAARQASEQLLQTAISDILADTGHEVRSEKWRLRLAQEIMKGKGASQ